MKIRSTVLLQPRPATFAAWILLAAYFAASAWLADSSLRRFEANVQNLDPTAPPVAQIQSQRVFIDSDSYYWLTYARQVLETGRVRIRSTAFDNAPDGREMHWSHPLIWSIAGLARGLQAMGLPPPTALEWAGRAVMPLAGTLFMTLVFGLLIRRLDMKTAALVVAVLATSLAIQWDFHAFRPDHNGLQMAAAAGMVLGLFLGGFGWQRRPEAAQLPSALPLPDNQTARRWFAVAGLCGATGLWLGATVFLFSLAAVSLAAALGFVVLNPPLHKKSPAYVPAPDLWRTWSRWGAAAALLFYAVEYAPAHFSMRLEANHPLYALCWLGCGECLRAVAEWRRQGRRFAFARLVPAAGGLAAALALPLLVLFGPERLFFPKTLLMQRLHALNILEFMSLPRSAGAGWPLVAANTLGVGLLALPLAAVLATRSRLSFPVRMALAFLAVLAAAYFALYFWQIRWNAYALVSALLLTAVVLLAAREMAATAPAAPWRFVRPVLAALMIMQAGAGVVRCNAHVLRMRRLEKIDELWLKALLQRNAMLQLRQRPAAAPLRFLLTPELAPLVAYFGVGDSGPSLYWENLPGLSRATAILAAVPPGDEAHALAKQLGITHVWIQAGAGDALLFNHLATGSVSHPAAAATIAGSLARSGTPIPEWLEPDAELTALVNRTYGLATPYAGGLVPIHLDTLVYRVK